MTNTNLYDSFCIGEGATKHSGCGYIEGHENLNRDCRRGLRRGRTAFDSKIEHAMLDKVLPTYTSFEQVGLRTYEAQGIGPDDETLHDYDNIRLVESPYSESDEQPVEEPAVMGVSSKDQGSYEFVVLPTGLIERSAYEVQEADGRKVVNSEGDRVVAIKKRAGTPNLATETPARGKESAGNSFSARSVGGLNSIVAQKF